ncbi:MAG UNVERIFIED_CONTAM: hypothetical protein LVR29_21480 [Microcystis novacekii LVE1205-3]
MKILINHCKRSYRGKVIVLAAGATESPCIALRSDSSDKSGKIGIGLTDHQRQNNLLSSHRWE